MNGWGRIVTGPAFASWITARERQYATITKTLPPYGNVYYPQPIRRAS
jgi:hypothetical protein